jgi:predicted Zn-dependent peptidase
MDNGLTIVQVHQPHLHRGSIAVYFRIGSRFECPEDNGLSHFLEHMIFRGSRNHPSAYLLNLAVEQLGGTLFAATAPDSTEFEMTLPPESIDAGIALMAEIVTQPKFCDISIERRVIAEEIREDLDENGKPIDIDYLSRSRLWPRHSLGQPVTGPIENVLRFDDADVRRHFEKNYTAANAIVAVSGSFEVARTYATVERCFRDLPPGGGPRGQKSPELGPGPTAAHTHRPGSQTVVRIAFHAPGQDDDDRAALSILLGLLDDGMSSRLHRRIFDECGLAYNLGADIDPYADVSAFNIDASTSHENVLEIVIQLLALVEELRDQPVCEDELAKTIRRAVWSIDEFQDDPHAMSGWYGEQELFRRPISLEDWASRLASVKMADIKRVASRVFNPGNLHLTTVGVLKEANRGRIERIVSKFLR